MHACGIGAVCNGMADDGALITQGLANHFGTLATGALTAPVEIDFGNATYNLTSPIVINQNFIRIVGEPKFQCNGIANAFVINAGSALANIFGVEVKGTITGTVTGDAVLLQQATQCRIELRNRAAVTGAVAHFQGCYSCVSRCSSDAEQGASAGHVHKETLLPLNGQLYNTINSDIDALGYYNTVSGVYISESQGFTIRGDLEHAQGPGVHLVNAQHGVIGIYTEANGQGAAVPADILLESGGGQVVMNCDANMIDACRFGGEMIDVDKDGTRETIPINVHVVSAYRTLIGHNSVGGRIVLESGADQTYIGRQMRLLNPVENHGSNTVNAMEGGYYITTVHDTDIDSDHLATIMLPVPEPDANYTVQPSVYIIDGTAPTDRVNFAGAQPDRFYIIVPDLPGAGKAFNVVWKPLRLA